MPEPANSKLLDLLKNKNRSSLNIAKVVRKSDGTVVRASEHATKKTVPGKVLSNGAGRSNTSNGLHSATRQKTSSTSRQISTQSPPPIRQLKTQRSRRATPSVPAPRLTDSDDDDDEFDVRRKRMRMEHPTSIDHDRKIRDTESFIAEDTTENSTGLVHAAGIANSETQEHGRYKYGAFFTALAIDEDECPTVKLQYPSAAQTERYQLVKPTDPTDFRPLSEIIDNMKVVADFYVDDTTAEKISCPEDGSGLVEQLQKHARDGDKSKPGAQTKFIEVITKYNELLSAKRKDGTLAKHLDEMTYIPLKLVEHIVKNQVYSRTVSPHVNLVRQYEGFSDNVYGELLPRFLSEIFKITRLKSNHVFVDLGSGVGNCVLQAALETGCESWGCEMMSNCAKLAELQAEEFVPRCRMWGIKPGRVRLIQGDFLQNEEIKAVLKRADVVLINNQAFTPKLNDELKYIFLDLKEGCQIISLKPYRDPSHKIKEQNIHDPINVLSVLEKERFSGMVSWTDDPGKWFLQVKDSTALRKFTEKTQKR